MLKSWFEVWFCIIIGLNFICGIVMSKKFGKIIKLM